MNVIPVQVVFHSCVEPLANNCFVVVFSSFVYSYIAVYLSKRAPVTEMC